MKKVSPMWGLIFIFIGGLLLYDNIFDANLFSISRLWPIIILGLGLIFELSYFFGKKSPGFLVPGGILTVIGFLFLFESITGWNFSKYTWPVYIIAVAFGLFQLYLFSGKPKGLLIPVFVLTTVSVVSFGIIMLNMFISVINLGLLIPLALFLLGGYIIYNSLRN
ncbi:MAG TPA: hypothetical protein PK033_07005 [Acetivibrio sp.]|nr:hypothetical protein [Clostridium sp.]HOQ38347.1 hypothetical protein [Acetivibrio sp.]HQA57612.1 hypothetical protein [Acetivibrio sp.]